MPMGGENDLVSRLHGHLDISLAIAVLAPVMLAPAYEYYFSYVLLVVCIEHKMDTASRDLFRARPADHYHISERGDVHAANVVQLINPSLLSWNAMELDNAPELMD
jgi:hypothetical protein